jgi:hypothetical protein
MDEEDSTETNPPALPELSVQQPVMTQALPTLSTRVQPVSAYSQTNTDDVPQKKSVFLIFILTLVTLYIYTPLWYIKRTRQFHNLGTQKKLVKALPTILFIFNIMMVLCILGFVLTITPEMGTFYEQPTLVQTVLMFFILIAVVLTFSLTIITSFYTRTIINQALENKGMHKKLSVFYTLIFGHFYLQYEINRIINDKEETPRIAPLIIILLLLLIAGTVIFTSFM